MTESKGTSFEIGVRPKGLAPDGMYTKSHTVRDRNSGRVFYIPAGAGLANLLATGHDLEIVDYKRKGTDRPAIGGAQED